ncbi:MAG: lysine exporter LysO family protein [Atribacterota bacterium]|nr:lysine exporter LysO family protein [Atribacterota bacterium]
MTRYILISLSLGILCGYWRIVPSSLLQHFHHLVDVALFVLVLGVGMELAANRRALFEVKAWGWRILFLPLSGVIGSLCVSFLSSFFLPISWPETMAIVSGFGWYSFSGALLSHLAGPHLGATAFLSNLFRELLAFLSVGVVFRYFGNWAAVALGGATSMDTTLGPIVQASEGRLGALALLSGVIHSLLVPVLLPFWIRFL